MKKATTALLLCLVLALAACTSPASSAAATPRQNPRTTTSDEAGQTGTDEFAHIGRIEENVDIPAEFPYWEMPYFRDKPESEVRAYNPEMDFLDADQQDLYRQAHYFTSRLMQEPSDLGSPHYLPLLDGQQTIEGESVTIEGQGTYRLATGRYRNWDDFEAVAHHLFTPEFFQQLNGEDNMPRAISINGRLAFHEGARGSDMSHVGSDYELVSQDDSSIEFLLIGLYVDTRADDWHDKREAGEYDYTEEYTIRMVKSNGQWRFDEFHIEY